MRPAGDARQALTDAARRLDGQRTASAQRGATWRELAVHAVVGFGTAKATVRKMHRAGVLQRLPDDARASHSRRPMARYVPAPVQAQAQAGAACIDSVMRTWGAGLAR